MTWWFESGHAADLVLAVIAGEYALLVTRFGWSPRRAALRLLPGALMLLGLRAALVGAAWPWVALPLAASLPVHLLDLMGRGPGDARRPARPVRSS
ncbi:hypothetical protein COC42_04640 [Sphingomonas spermidinifaciens]|uniref:Uncharacterized protein n=2 Tax=Sphingomonas spermidinifaciens TaxID=1141889 RepID=A0A2A4BAL2_9SPHN|nr:hypothetical protein COC42_04640 [Sphingomonas spermidinifaciens]